MSERPPIGLLAGWGMFPVYFARRAQESGHRVVTVGLKHLADEAALRPYSESFTWNRVGAMNGPPKVFRRAGCQTWTMAGKLPKTLLFARGRWLNLLPDLRLIRFYLRRRRQGGDNRDDTLLLALIEEYARDGLACRSALEICPELLVRDGVLTRRSPTAAEWADIEFGWGVAREMGRLDVGQSVMVRDKVVVSVEAIEGTDAAIARAGELCQGGSFVVVKVAKPKQDMRFDVPTVGPRTVQTLADAGGRVLAIEARRTILIDEAATVEMADKCGIALVAWAGPAGSA